MTIPNSDSLLRITLSSIGDAVITTDAQARVTFLNPVAEALTGWTLAQAGGQPLDTVFRIVNERTRRPGENPATRVLREGLVVGLANHTVLIARDGTERPIDDSAAPIRDHQGTLVGVVLVFRDVTERRRAEQQIEHSEQRFRALMTATAQIVWTTNARGEVEADSPSWRAFTGQSYEQWRGRGWLDAIHPGDRERAARAWSEAIAAKTICETEYRVRRADGVYRWTQVRAVPVLNEHGDIREWVGMNIDVTDQRQAEQKLKESETRYRLISEAANDAIWDWDLVTDQVIWNEGVRMRFGYTADQVGADATWWYEHIHPDDRERIVQGIHAAIEGGAELWEDEYRYQRADGSYADVFDRGRVLRDAAGKPLRMVGSMLDLTERKRIEAAWQESERRFRTLVEQVQEYAIFMTDTQGVATSWNEGVRRVLGFEEAEFVGRDTASLIFTPEDVARGVPWQELEKAAAEETAADDRWMMRKDGTRFWASGITTSLWDDQGKLLGFTKVMRDQTARKHLEDALRESEQQLRLVLESMPQKIFTARPNGEVDYFNPPWMEFTGLSFEQIRNWGWTQFIHPDDLEENVRVWRRSIETGEPFAFEHRFRRSDGEYRWHISRARPVRDMEGRIILWIGSNTDIHEVRRTERELQTYRERLDLVVSTSAIGLWYCDVPFDKLVWNARVKEHFGLPSDAEVTIDTFYERLHPDDRERTRAAIEKSINERAHYDIEYRTLGLDGRERWIRAVGRAFYAADGTPTRFDGITLDVTEQRHKQLAQQLLLDIGQATQALVDPNETMRIIMRLLGQHLRVNRCAYAELEDDENHFTVTGDYTSETFSIIGRYGLSDFGPEALKLLRANEVYVVDDSESDPRTQAHLAAYRQTEIAAVICVPLHKAGRLVAAVAVHQKTPRHWTAEEIGLVGTVAERCWESIERARALKQLREEQERLRLAQRAGRIGMFEWRIPEDRVIWTPELESIYAVPPGTFKDSLDEWRSRVVPEDAARIMTDVQQCLQQQQTEYGYEFRAVLPDGSLRWLAGQALFEYDDEHRPLRMIGVNIDIDARKHMEETLREADRRKDDFLATLAHELRNPLAPLRTGLELMRLAPEDSALVEQARGTMERQLRHMVRLIDDLLDISRITRGKIRLQKSRVPLAVVVQDAVETVRPLVQESQHSLEIMLPPQTIYLYADAARLAQVLSNLLNNAVKYTSPGGRISLAAECAGKEITLRIRDNGIGIPPEMVDSIFEMFTQVDRSLERSRSGLGIGLSLAKRLVEMHGGRVEARSAGAGRGSEFIVRLPLEVEAGNAKQAPRTGDEVLNPDVRRILVVDDNQDAANALSEMLKLLGYAVGTAFDGEQALEVAASFRPDVLLLDLRMPRLDGYETARRLRREPWGHRPVLIALTGYGQEEDRQRTQEAGFDHHLVKPVEPMALQKLLNDLRDN